MVDFTVSNNADWFRTFTLRMGSGGTPPWSRVPAWAASTAYTSAAPSPSIVTYNGDLYIANPANVPQSWTSGPVFDAAQWAFLGSGAAFTQVPLDLTGATLRFGIRLTDGNGNFLTPRPSLLVSSADAGGFITFPNAAQGGVKLNIPLSQTKNIPAGVYAYDFVAVLANTQTIRALAGFFAVNQGIS